MTVISQRSARLDLVRSGLVALLAVVQIVVSALAGSGALGEPIGVVARDYRTPLLAADWAFVIWAPIYLGFLGYAVYQLLPGAAWPGDPPAHRLVAGRLGRVQRAAGSWRSGPARCCSPSC